MDFTIRKYRELLQIMIAGHYKFQTFEQFLSSPSQKAIILRHDVDLRPEYSLRFAQIQAEAGVQGVYYFRSVPESFDVAIIKAIHKLGHEIGYHYESLTTCKGQMENALLDFEINLKRLRQLVPVSTICMHGSPLSKFDSKDLWTFRSYKEYGIVGEPYFDLNFFKVLYLTDTGRRWDGEAFSVRDKVQSGFQLKFRSTDEIIKKFKQNGMPAQIMFTFHPQRWTDAALPWVREFLLQNLKNVVKKSAFVRQGTRKLTGN